MCVGGWVRVWGPGLVDGVELLLQVQWHVHVGGWVGEDVGAGPGGRRGAATAGTSAGWEGCVVCGARMYVRMSVLCLS